MLLTWFSVFARATLSSLGDLQGEFLLAGQATLYWLERTLLCRFPGAVRDGFVFSDRESIQAADFRRQSPVLAGVVQIEIHLSGIAW